MKPLLDLKIVTWNVLFDVFDQSEVKDETTERWRCLIAALSHCDADIITLQEVTPCFVNLLGSIPWIRSFFGMSAAPPTNVASVSPHFNLILFRLTSLSPVCEGLRICYDGGKNRA